MKTGFLLNHYQILFLLAFLFSCKKEEAVEIPPVQTGPYRISIPKHFGDYFIPQDNPLTKEGVALGRRLFYEKKLSNNNSVSCGSCHQQKFAFTDGKAFSTGSEGIEGNRSSMSLANLLWAKHFFWDGRSKSLEEQALIPIQDPVEMHQTLDEAVAKLQNTTDYPPLFKLVFGSEEITAENIAKALAQFERTLISSNSKYDQYLMNKYVPTVQELNGMQLFFTHPVPGSIRGGNCGDCHGGYLTMLNTFHNNGLDSSPSDFGRELITGQAFDRGKFKAPSLRNIALTAPYMHDGRFHTLEEVLDHYNEHIQKSSTLDPLILEASNEPIVAGGPVKLFLTDQEKKDIIAFLHMLTDSTFIENKAFSNPFE